MHDPVDIALAEDIGDGDLTSRYFVPENTICSARIFAKQEGVAAGVETAGEVFKRVDAGIEVEVVRGSGSLVHHGDTVLSMRGKAQSILTAERVALNFVQRLSGVATLTRKYIAAVEGTGVKILDTRKTTPGLRQLEKAAVKAGGGTNHRMGLYDMVMVKDNHLLAEDRFEELLASIAKLKTERPEVKVELEADTLEQVRRFVTFPGVDFILLDNMSNAMLREAVALRTGEILFEASGGVNLQTVRAIADTGVDFISVGALTHSAVALDFSLELT